MMDVDKNTGLPQLHSSHLWLLGIGSHPFKCTKTGMVDEAEEPINKVSGSKGVAVRCVTHHGHCLDGIRLVTSHCGRDWGPTMYIP